MAWRRTTRLSRWCRTHACPCFGCLKPTPRGWLDIHLPRHHRPCAGDPDARGAALHSIEMAGTRPAMTSKVRKGSSRSAAGLQSVQLGLVASLGLGIGRIQAGEGDTLLDLAHDPELIMLLRHCSFGNLFHHGGG